LFHLSLSLFLSLSLSLVALISWRCLSIERIGGSKRNRKVERLCPCPQEAYALILINLIPWVWTGWVLGGYLEDTGRVGDGLECIVDSVAG
jgi:hypothetical protein